MVSGLTPPSKNRDSDELRNDLNDLRDIVRYGGISTNTSDTNKTIDGGKSTPAVNGLFSLEPSIAVESVILSWTTPVTPPTAVLNVGDIISTNASGWTGKLTSIIETDPAGTYIRGVFEPTNASVPDLTNVVQTLSKSGWSASYIVGSNDPNILLLNTTSAIIKTVDNGDPMIDTIIGTINDGQVVLLKPKYGKTLTINTGANIDLTSPVVITHSNFAMLQFHDDNILPDDMGNYILISGGGGGSSSSSIKDPCRVASTGNNIFHPLWGTTIDGVVLTAGQRFLIKDQTTAQDNGIYVHSGSAIIASTRATDFTDGSTQTGSMLVAVQEGTVNADTLWQLTTNDIITVGTTGLSFTQFTGGSDNLGNHTATQTLKMKDFAIFLDTAEAQSIIALATANNYIVPIGGAHDFYVNSLLIPKFGITETSIESNVDLDMNAQDITTIGNIDFGTGSPTSGRIRIPNTSSIKWESVAPTGNYGELLYDVDEKFFWAVPSGGAFGFWAGGFLVAEINSTGINMQLNSITNLTNIEVNSSSSVAGFRDLGHTTDPSTPLAGELYYNTTSNIFKFYNGSAWLPISASGSTSFIGFIADADLDMDGFNIKSTTTPSVGNQFRIVFDAHLDSDTYISNSTVADRISVVSNGTAVMEILDTEILLDTKINMNGRDITIIGNMDFGAGAPASGRIRLPNTSGTIKWEASPSTGFYGEIVMDVDEELMFSVPASGTFGYWIGDAVKSKVAEFNSSGLDLQFGTLTNATVITDTSAGTAGYRDLGHTADPTTPLAGEMYYNTTTNTYKFYNGSIWVSMSSSGSTSFIGFTADADLNMGSFNILTTTDPATNILRFIFDGHDDSDTYISNSTTVDRINVVNNAINTVAFRTTDMLMGVDIEANTKNIKTVGNIDFGTGSATSGRIRLPNNASIKWESVPAGNAGEILYDVDEKFFFAVPSTGGFGFWVGGFLIADISSTQLSVSENLVVSGNSTFNGATTSINSATINIGNATTDQISMDARFITSILPNGNSVQSLGGASNHWDEIYTSDLVLRGASGSIGTTTPKISASSTGMSFNVPSGDSFTLYTNGLLGVTFTGVQSGGVNHNITTSDTKFGIYTSASTDSLEFHNGLSRSAPTLTIDTLSAEFRTTDTTTSAYALDLIQDNTTPVTSRLIAGIRGIAENNLSVDTTYGEIDFSCGDSITDGSESGRVQIWVQSDSSLASAINILGNTTTGGVKIGFFGTTPSIRATGYNVVNFITDRVYDANATSTAELADVLGTLIADLKLLGLIA